MFFLLLVVGIKLIFQLFLLLEEFLDHIRQLVNLFFLVVFEFSLVRVVIYDTNILVRINIVVVSLQGIEACNLIGSVSRNRRLFRKDLVCIQTPLVLILLELRIVQVIRRLSFFNSTYHLVI